MRTRTIAVALLAIVVAIAATWMRNRAPAAPSSDGASAHRMVVLAVGSTDMLAKLGALDRVVAVEERDYTRGAEGKVRIPRDATAGRFSIEAILALEPDLVVGGTGSTCDVIESLGLRVLRDRRERFDSLPDYLTELAGLVGRPERGRELVAAYHATTARLRAATDGLPRVRVYYERGPAPGSTAGRGSGVDRMILLAGGANIAGEEPLAIPVLTMEAVIAADPEVIVLSPFAEPKASVMARPGWDRIAAVRTGRVHQLAWDDRDVMIVSIACVDGCERHFLPWFHPGAAAKTR